MLAELVMKDGRQEIRADEAPGCHMEWGWRLADLLAVPAGEALPHRLDHLPLAWDDLKSLSDILAQLGEAVRSAAGAALRSQDDDALARQMHREGLSARPLARKGMHEGRGLGGCLLCCQFILGGTGFQFFKLQLHLIEEPRLVFRADAVELAPQLLDLQPQMADQGVGTAVHCQLPGRFGLRLQSAGIGGQTAFLHRQNSRFHGSDIIGQLRCIQCHDGSESQGNNRVHQGCAATYLSCRLRSPCPPRIAPVDPVQHVAELCCRDGDDTVSWRRPDELAVIQTLGIERQADPIMPDDLHQITATPPEDVEVADMGIAAKGLLHLQRQPRHAAPHVRIPSRQPDAGLARQTNHRSAPSTRRSASGSIPDSTYKRMPLGSAISIWPRPPVATDLGVSDAASAICAVGSCPWQARNSRRQAYSRPREIP